MSGEEDPDSDDKAQIKDAVEYILTIFREPLEAKEMSVFKLPGRSTRKDRQLTVVTLSLSQTQSNQA